MRRFNRNDDDDDDDDDYNNTALLPWTPPLPLLRQTPSFDFSIPTFRNIEENPLTTLARTRPRLAFDAICSRSLDETHQSAVAGPAMEFAKQGRGMHAITRRRRGFFGGETVETIIRPI